jgi:hypothetical protein
MTFRSHKDAPAQQLNVVGRWMPFAEDEIDCHANPMEVEVPVAGGYRGAFLACAPPASSPLDGHLLLLELFSVRALATDVDFLL